MNPEQENLYSIEKAQEAEKLRGKVDRGQAIDYAEAERQLTDEEGKSNKTISLELKGEIKKLERTSINFPALVQFYERTNPDADAKTTAYNDLRQRALTICDNDPSQIDEYGLPRDRRAFAKLEANVKRFLDLAEFRYKISQKTRTYEKISGQSDPRQQIAASDRGKLEEVLDKNDPVIGPYITELEEAAGLSGTTTDRLTWLNHSIKNPQDRERILKTCFSIARDMVLLIGEEKYNQLREKLDLKYFQDIDGTVLTSTPAIVAARMYRERNPKGYWNALPRVWVEELMLLVKNPDLIETLATADVKKGTVKNIRNWAQRMTVEKSPTVRMTEIEYLRRNIKPEELPNDIIDEVVKGLSSLRSLETLPYRERGFAKIMRKLKQIVHNYLGTKPWQRRIALDKLVSVISNYDKGYRKGDPSLILKKSLLTSDGELESVIAALREGTYLHEKFNPQVMRDENTGFTLCVEPIRLREGWKPVLKIIDTKEGKLIRQQVQEDEIEALFQDERFGSLREQILGLFEKARAEVKKRRESAVIWNDSDSLYNLYAKIRYAYKVLPRLFPDKVEQDRATLTKKDG